MEEEKEEEDAYTVLNAPGSGLRDIRPSIPPERRYGHEMTFTGFDGRGDGDGRCRRIDFIHVDVGSGTSVNSSDGDGDTDGDEDPTRQYRREAENTSEDRDQDEANANANAKRNENEDEDDAASPWHITGYAVLPNRFDDGVYMSDHRAVVGDLLLR
ncbi:hypothetical protein EPUS_08813 [Endocarpon pusillum Z07020]|uniref:Endonuclease/exonuclease/phosphatase domain-containing protein n=1 Tax=Endocarpon pusillum (strain Z07020 / HMAS-L-300199) TaxID=1263415 RepID=U1HXW6_ENDPU|nr:uncharacterized protein EPUS_08813 [Endocarpon pusillum Z07020]ERF75660.1 hypothetical protein EPUS_08813 [Endocarpon pusillum Z07020]